MKRVFDETGAQLANPSDAPHVKAEVAPDPPSDADTSPALSAEPAAASAPPASSQPASLGTPEPAPAPAVDHTQQMLQHLAATQQKMADVLAAQHAALQPKEAPKPERRPPTVEEALEDFKWPVQKNGEDANAYNQRMQAAVFDHIRAKDREYILEDAKRAAREEGERWRQEQREAVEQQQAAQRYVSVLDEATKSAGYKTDTPAGRLIRNYVDRTLTSLHTAGHTRAWGEREWKEAARMVTAEAAQMLPPPPMAGAAPALSVVPNSAAAAASPAAPPISGGGKGSTPVPNTPPTKQAAKPQNFAEAMGNVFEEHKRLMG